MNKRKIIYVFMLSVLFAPLLASALSINLLNRKINIPIPDGYCPLEDWKPDNELIETVKTTLQTGKQVIAIFANCNELGLFRKNRKNKIKNYAWIFYVSNNGVLAEYKKENRESFIRKMSNIDFGPVMKEAKTKILKDNTDRNLDVKSSNNKFVNNNGVFIGIQGEMGDLTGELRSVRGVLCMTFVKSIPFSINFYRASGTQSDVEKLLDIQIQYAEKFVQENE